MMLEGKMPVSVMATTATSDRSSPAGPGSPASGQIIYQDKVIYKELDNKENRQLEEELRNKDNLLRNEQEEKKLLREKLEGLQQNFEVKNPDKEDKSEM